MKEKVLAIVVSYYPNVEELQRNISSYIDNVDKLIIWENTPECDAYQYRLDTSLYQSKIIYMGEGENKYIAYALNKAVRYALDNGYSYLLTMDQDSCFLDGDFKKYVEVVLSYNGMAIFGPHLLSNIAMRITMEESIVLVKDLPTSGNLVNVNIYKKIGLYNEKYAIDCVDFEYCYRAERAGISSLRLNFIGMLHSVGQSRKTIWGFTTRDYSVDRLYHISRNNIWLYRDYPEKGWYNIKFWILRIFVKVVLGERNKCAKIKAICRGVYDGFALYAKKSK